MKTALSRPQKGGPHARASSPRPGRSTLTTSAPMSPSGWVQNGPATFWVRSTTTIPSSGRATDASVAAPVAAGESPSRSAAVPCLEQQRSARAGVRAVAHAGRTARVHARAERAAEPEVLEAASTIRTSSQKSCAMVSAVRTPGAKRSRRVRSPVAGSRPSPSARRGEERLDQRTRGGRLPRARPRRAADEPALAVEQRHRRRAPPAIHAARRVAALVEQHGGGVAALGDRFANDVGTLAEVDQADLQTPGLVLLIEGVDGRQLLPTVRSPGGPGEEEHHLAAQRLERLRRAVEPGQRERGRGLRRLVGLDLEAREIGGGGRDRRDRQGDGGGERDDGGPHFAPESLSACRTSSGLSSSSGFC